MSTPPHSLLALAGHEGPSTALAYADQPIWRCARTGIWVVESHALVREALLRPADFSSRVSLSALDPGFPAADVDAIHREGGARWTRTLQTNDPPSHRRFRAVVDRAFTAGKVDSMASGITRVADALLDRWPVGEPVDAMAGYASPLPLQIIAEQLGVGAADFPLLKQWSDAAIRAIGLGATPEEHREAAYCGVAFQRYFTAVLRDPRLQPSGSLIALISAAATNLQPALTLAEQLSLLHTLMIAGHETTTSSMGSILLHLAEHPNLMSELREDESRLKLFIEHVLRVHAPVQGLFRVTTREVQLGELVLPAGALLSLRLGAANRDPSRFGSSDRFVADSEVSAHLSFGVGLHHCIGAALARRELLIATRAVLQRHAELRLTVPREQLRYSSSVMTRGLLELPLLGVPHAA